MLVCLGCSCSAQVLYQTIDLQSQANKRLDNLLIPYPNTFPLGIVQLGGVPFFIPSTGNNVWLSAEVSGGPEVSATWSVNIPNITGFYTLMNTYWGQAGSPLTFAVFGFSDSSRYWYPLFGNDDIRDYSPWIFTNNINNTSTVNVFLANAGNPRLDRQFINLEEAGFGGKTLTTFSIYDYGGPNFHRAFIAGATAAVIPEPSSLSLLLAGGAMLMAGRRRK